MRSFILATMFAVLPSMTAPALAQQTPAARARPGAPGVPRTEAGTGWRAFMTIDHVSFTAKETFDAVTGSSTATLLGAGGEVRFWKGLFARGGFSRTSLDGTRGFVVQGQFVSTGIPLTVEIVPVELAAGWRFVLDRRQRFVVYGGGGMLRVGYKETSDFADPGDEANESFTGYLAFGGVDVRITPWIFAGVEFQHRSVADAFGPDGIAGAFEESDLGGSVVRFMFGVRR